MRRLFVDELQHYLVPTNLSNPNYSINDLMTNADRNTYDKRAVLSWEQFELIVDLFDEALRHEAQTVNSGITPIIMDLSTRLCTVGIYLL